MSSKEEREVIRRFEDISSNLLLVIEDLKRTSVVIQNDISILAQSYGTSPRIRARYTVDNILTQPGDTCNAESSSEVALLQKFARERRIYLKSIQIVDGDNKYYLVAFAGRLVDQLP